MGFYPAHMRENPGGTPPSNFNQDIIDQFRANNGTMVSGMFKGAPLLLLTTTGAKSGQTRINPLAYTRDGERYVICASKPGAAAQPDWFHNVVAHPEVTIEVGPTASAPEPASPKAPSATASTTPRPP